MMNISQNSEGKLVHALILGDKEAFTTIYQKYWYKMFMMAYKKLSDREAAEEIVQDIFTNLWKERGNLKIGNLEHYLFSAVRYEVIDVIRLRGTQNKYLEYYQAYSVFHSQNTENTIDYNELLACIEAGLEELPDKSREIFKLNRLDKWPIAKIAIKYQLSEKAVEYHITKATKSIRLYLKETLIGLSTIISTFYIS